MKRFAVTWASALLLALILVMAILAGGCSTFCANKAVVISSMALAQTGYDAYIKNVQAGPAPTDTKAAQTRTYLILADQILAMAGPYLQDDVVAICPPDTVASALASKAAQAEAVKPPLVSP